MRLINATLRAAEIPDDLPNHLNGLATIVNKCPYVEHPNEQQYADASMALAGLSAQVGECADLKTIREFMRKERNEIRRKAEQQEKLIEGIESWLRWAVIWTLHKDGKEL